MRILHSLSVCCAVPTLVLAGPLRAQENLGFEAAGGEAPGWSRPADGALDLSVARSGRSSWRLEASREGRGTRVGQSLEAAPFARERVRIEAHVLAERGAAASLWIRVDSDASLIYVDSVTAPTARGEWLELGIDAPVSAQAVRISFGGAARGDGRVWFDDFEVSIVDTEREPPPSRAASAYLDRALDLMQSHSINRDRVDWAALRDDSFRLARGARTVDDAHLPVRFALGELADRHSYFMTARQMTTLDEAPVSNARTGRAPIPPAGARLEGGVALIDIPGFAGGDQRAQAEFAGTLHELARSLEPAARCGWIVDLRDNNGGNLWPMLAGVGPLLGDGEAVAAVYPDGERQSLWYVDGKAGLGDYVQLRVNSPFEPRTDVPIAVLTDHETASSAEILVAALRADGRTRVFGRATRGVSTGTRTIPLSDGAALILTVAATSDPSGRIYDGPIEPDIAVPGPRPRGAQKPLASQPDIIAARAWLTAQCSPQAENAGP